MIRYYHAQPLLRLQNVNTYYGLIHILQDVSLEVYPGELVCLLGGNARANRPRSRRSSALSSLPAEWSIFDGLPVHNCPTSFASSMGWRSCRKTAASSAR